MTRNANKHCYRRSRIHPWRERSSFLLRAPVYVNNGITNADSLRVYSFLLIILTTLSLCRSLRVFAFSQNTSTSLHPRQNPPYFYCILTQSLVHSASYHFTSVPRPLSNCSTVVSKTLISPIYSVLPLAGNNDLK